MVNTMTSTIRSDSMFGSNVTIERVPVPIINSIAKAVGFITGLNQLDSIGVQQQKAWFEIDSMYLHIKKSKDAFEVESLLMSTVTSSYDPDTELITLAHHGTTLRFKANDTEDQIRWVSRLTDAPLTTLDSQYDIIHRTGSMPHGTVDHTVVARTPPDLHGRRPQPWAQHHPPHSSQSQPLQCAIDPADPPPPYQP